MQGRLGSAIAIGAIALTVTLGVVLRLADPLSSPVVPAEDPYNHMALVREHLRTGDLDALNAGETLYPPGLHGFLAAAWVFTGIDLYDIILFGPVVFGAIGILGMALLLWRSAGPVAAFVGSLALAVAPEAIFRTTMMSPTALDLAIVPFFLYALLRILAGRLAWVGVAAPMAIFMAFAHPWLLAILCATGVAFLLFTFLFPAVSARAEPISMAGVPWCIAVLGSGLSLALMMPNFGFVLPSAGSLMPLGFIVGAVALAPVLIFTVSPLRLRARWLNRTPAHALVRAGLSLAIAAGVVAIGLVVARRGLPPFVDLDGMFGWPMLLLAFAALVALPFIASPLANLSAALVAVTAPFVLFNPLDSEFLSHRTAVFLGIGLAALAGLAAAGAVRLVQWALLAAAAKRTRSPGPSPHRGRATFLALAPTLLVASLLGGTVYAGTPDGYPGGWYRLYNSCELDALREIAAKADAQPSAIIITGDWQSKLVLAALTEDATRVWFQGAFYSSEQVRGDLVAQMERQGRPLIVLDERHLRAETPDADTGFMESAPWTPIGSWCANMGVERPRVTAYTTEEGPT